MSDSDEPVDTGFRERLWEQAERSGVSIDTTKIAYLEHYFRLLRHWNRRMNLTALPLSDLPGRTLNRLFIEPLQAATLVGDSPLQWFDLGSGGGSPAIPMKIVRPQLRLTMVEARSKKVAFLREVVRSLALTTTDVLSIRIEELPKSTISGQADLLTIRAVRLDERVLQTAAALLRPGGRLLSFGTESPHSRNHGDFRVIQQLTLFGGESALQVLSKVA